MTTLSDLIARLEARAADEYDNLKAVRFARKQDAELMSRYMFPGEPHRIADHMWCP